MNECKFFKQALRWFQTKFIKSCFDAKSNCSRKWLSLLKNESFVKCASLFDKIYFEIIWSSVTYFRQFNMSRLIFKFWNQLYWKEYKFSKKVLCLNIKNRTKCIMKINAVIFFHKVFNCNCIFENSYQQKHIIKYIVKTCLIANLILHVKGYL